ncbi:antibiotic biosynthesis monooxygenase [Lentzea sp. NPDC051208]|uniref:putative quinol monooxygenase n=1 Tax=Lentzea sp. NPDC051208 TaxID=3154642 RepID=UPI0034365522
MSGTAVAVLGRQFARPGEGAELVRLNVALGRALHVPGLLRYQVLVRPDDETELCVYWLWRDLADREAVWAAPPPALTAFWESAKPLWRKDPDVRRYRWEPAAERDLAPEHAVVLDAGDPAAGDHELIDIDGGATLRCRPAGPSPAPGQWTGVWRSSATEERRGV